MIVSGQLEECKYLGMCTVPIKDEQDRAIGGCVCVFYEMMDPFHKYITLHPFARRIACNLIVMVVSRFHYAS